MHCTTQTSLLFLLVVVVTSMISPGISFPMTNRWFILSRQRVMVRSLTTNIIIVGKQNGGEQFIDDGCHMYEKRLTPVMKVNTIFLKTDKDLVTAAKGLKGKAVWALDENGRQYSSREFADVVYDGLQEGGATITFIVGGAFGLPEEIKKSFPLISLSKMTWTHQMARLLLVEQIYRSSELKKGSNYHKD